MKILGIDPGIKNTGFCLINDDFSVLDSGVSPASIDLIEKFLSYEPDVVVIERFVHYQTKMVDVEKVNRFIGMLEYAFKDRNLILVRAVDWQKEIFGKLGVLPVLFGKPRRKVNSKEVAKKYFRKTFKTEHEADAFFLACYGNLTTFGKNLPL